MIEALVALLVLALGVMGLAGIQTRTLVDARSTNERAVAVRMTEDLMERMEANATEPPNSYVVGWGSPGTATDCFTTACTPTQLAAFDLAQWKTSLSQLLPGGDARIFVSTTDATQFGVMVGWNETQAKNQGSASTTELAQYTGRLAVTTGVDGITCPTGRICHLVYIRP